MTHRHGAGWIFLPALILAIVLAFCIPAQAVEACVTYATICVPGYVVKYLPPEPETEPPTPLYVSLVAKYFPPELVGWALAILECESGGDPEALNRQSGAAGLFQFLRSTWDRGPAPALGLPSYDSGAPYVAEWNIRAAAWLYANWGGRSQWSCRA